MLVILDRYGVKLHQLTPNEIVLLLKHFWIEKTLDGVISANCFTRLFDLHYQRKIIKLKDEKFHEAHYGCCTFKTRRKTLKVNQIELSPSYKNKWDDDWLQ
jgi:hypothetical protein